MGKNYYTLLYQCFPKLHQKLSFKAFQITGTTGDVFVVTSADTIPILQCTSFGQHFILSSFNLRSLITTLDRLDKSQIQRPACPDLLERKCHHSAATANDRVCVVASAFVYIQAF